MRKTFLFIAILLTMCPVAMSRNYYKEKSFVKAQNIIYVITDYNKNFKSLELENQNNILLKGHPYNTKEGRYFTYEEHPWRYVPKDQIESILAPILNPEGKRQNMTIDIIMAFDPRTKIIKEVKYDLWYKENRKVLSIPPEKFEELENRLVGARFEFSNIDYLLVADFLRGYYQYKF